MKADEFRVKREAVCQAIAIASQTAEDFAFDLPPDHPGIARVQNLLYEAAAALRTIVIPF